MQRHSPAIVMSSELVMMIYFTYDFEAHEYWMSKNLQRAKFGFVFVNICKVFSNKFLDLLATIRTARFCF